MVKHYETHPTPQAWIAAFSAARGEIDAAQLTRALTLYENKSQPDLADKGSMIADMLLTLEMDTETILAAFLYPALKNHYYHQDFIAEHFGVAIAKLLNDCLQMQSLEKVRNIGEDDTHQIENVRKMLLAMVTDPRAVLIILAERLWLLRNAKEMSDVERKKLARETLDIYAPLANRIGVWQLKWEIEDLCLRYLAPDVYKNIATWLSSRRTEREAYLVRAITIFNDLLAKNHIPKFEIHGRVKHIYSIYNKMQRKNVPIEEIYDISALRVLVPAVADCYSVLSLIQAEYQRIPQEFDDYIAQPKPNGYQSIHTVLYGPDEKIIEVQIRTYDMHHLSELGAASHWRYKEGMSQEAAYEVKIALLRQIMAWQKEVASGAAEPKAEQPAHDIFADRVYVFTPLGDIVDLPHGATPLDFAYHVHSEVGHRCRGAKVDGKMVPLTHTLQTGNRVEILTAKQPNPSRDWLNLHAGYLKSPRARSVLAHYFRVKDSAAEKELKKEKPVAPEPPAARKIADQHTELTQELHKAPSGKVTGVDSLLTKFAMCCKPLPGDAIIGYITQNRGVSIHRRDCSNLANLEHNDLNRFMEVNWGKTAKGRYPVELEVRVNDRANMLRDITGSLANEELTIAGLRTQLHTSGEASVFVTIMITGVDEMNKAVNILKQIDQVLTVRRL